MRCFKLLLFLCLLSCVKENRSSCPCRLNVDLSDVDTSVVSGVRVMIDAADAVDASPVLYHEESYMDSCLFRDGVLLKVPRRMLWLNVYSVAGESDAESYSDVYPGLVIPYGEDCPPIYMYSALVDADCEQTSRKVRLSKNHCRMIVLVESQENFGYELRVSGNICGYSADGRPLSGDFGFVPHKEEDGSYVAVIPRQTDTSMLLEVMEDGEVLKIFTLGEYVSASGYDWTSSDLSDLVVQIDYAMTRISISVADWDEVCEEDVVI